MAGLKSINPSNGKVLGEVEVSSEKEIKAKVEKAKKARSEWGEIGLEARVKLLRRVVEELRKSKDELALLASQEMGMPISDTKHDVEDAANYFNWYLDNAEKYLSSEVIYEDNKIIHKVFYEPYGVAAAITPWNFPASNFVWMVGQNLVIGNVVVFKDAEEVPLFGKRIEEILMGAGLPEGVFSEVYGDGEIGNSLIHQDINLICFTGSTATGRKIYKVAAEKMIKVFLELGGSAPGIVFEDADVDRVLDTIYANRFLYCGQVCDGLKRLIIHESLFDEVVEKLKSKLEAIKLGDATKEDTQLGPLVSEGQLKVLESQVADAVSKGAGVVTGGKRPKSLPGWFYLPTILKNIKRSMRVWNEEVFGPVLPVVPFKTEEEAIKAANDTRYGLGGYVFTEDKEKATRVSSQLETGMISVNNASYLQPCSPFGGYKESGIGREHGKFGFHDLSQAKLVSFEK